MRASLWRNHSRSDGWRAKAGAKLPNFRVRRLREWPRGQRDRATNSHCYAMKRDIGLRLRQLELEVRIDEAPPSCRTRQAAVPVEPGGV